MTTELYSKELLRTILASIPQRFDSNLQLRVGEPNSFQLLKLAIRAFFNNILRCPFLEIHGNDVLKALWLLQNIDCARRVFDQHNYLDLFPFVGGDPLLYEPSFMTNLKLPRNVVHQWDLMLEWLPNLMAANTSLARARVEQRDDVWKRFKMIGDSEQQTNKNVHYLAINLMYELDEFDGTLDRFIDMFLPIDRDDEDEMEQDQDEIVRKLRGRETTEQGPIFSDMTMCLLAMSSDGSKILNILTESDQDNIMRRQN